MQADPLYGYFSSVAGPVSFKCFNDLFSSMVLFYNLKHYMVKSTDNNFCTVS